MKLCDLAGINRTDNMQLVHCLRTIENGTVTACRLETPEGPAYRPVAAPAEKCDIQRIAGGCVLAPSAQPALAA